MKAKGLFGGVSKMSQHTLGTAYYCSKTALVQAKMNYESSVYYWAEKKGSGSGQNKLRNGDSDRPRCSSKYQPEEF